ncbi:hypothetical protein BDW74DRAFT_56833 [Aspergillus multicolor]|uniref:uncharacterized protein n=1 Tax=Aspergillus multicolor TaxID=41759 RepID=UPI003CCD4C25
MPVNSGLISGLGRRRGMSLFGCNVIMASLSLNVACYDGIRCPRCSWGVFVKVSSIWVWVNVDHLPQGKRRNTKVPRHSDSKRCLGLLVTFLRMLISLVLLGLSWHLSADAFGRRYEIISDNCIGTIHN